MAVIVPLTLEVLGDAPAGMRVLESLPVPMTWFVVGAGVLLLLVFVWRKRDTFIYHQT